MARQYQFTTTSKIGAIAFAVVLLGVVGFFLAFGFVLVFGLAIAGIVLGIGAALRRKLSGAPAPDQHPLRARRGLDPAMEVQSGAAQPLPVSERRAAESDNPV